MSQTTSVRGRYAWVTVPASFYFELNGASHDPELDKFNFRVGGRIVEAIPSGGLLLDIDAYEDATGTAAPLVPRPGITPIPSEKIKRIDLVARLSEGDPYAPFRYHLGDEVAEILDDGTPDPEKHGVIVNGTCEYQLGGGSYRDTYEVKRADGTIFSARSTKLTRREPPFTNVR
jgi:hypothetical protein